MFQALSNWGLAPTQSTPKTTPRSGKSSHLTITTNDGVQLAYEVFGEEKEGPVVLLIHGPWWFCLLV